MPEWDIATELIKAVKHPATLVLHSLGDEGSHGASLSIIRAMKSQPYAVKPV